MRRGTTQILTFTLPEEIAINALYITFAQDNRVVLEKALSDVSLDGADIILPLTQEDTLAFSAGVVTAQIRLRDAAGNALASNPIRFDAEEVLKNGVI